MSFASTQALRPSDHSTIVACTVSTGISAAAFMKDLFILFRVLRCFWHAMTSKTAYSLLSRVLSSALKGATPRH